MAALTTLLVGLFVVVSSGLEQDNANIDPAHLEMLWETDQLEEFSRIMNIDVNLVRQPAEISQTPMINKDLEMGDIVLTDKQREEGRQAIRFDRHHELKWPNGSIPFWFIGFNATQRAVVLSAIDTWNEQIDCIKFRPWTSSDNYCIHFINGNGCYSYIGRVGGHQVLSLNIQFCLNEPTILHQLMHVIGFAHEHNRIDRDHYIEMHWENIPVEWRFLYYKKHAWSYSIEGDYDYYSLTHAPVNVFGMTRTPAFDVIHSGIYLRRIGTGTGFSHEDLNKIAVLYC